VANWSCPHWICGPLGVYTMLLLVSEGLMVLATGMLIPPPAPPAAPAVPPVGTPPVGTPPVGTPLVGVPPAAPPGAAAPEVGHAVKDAVAFAVLAEPEEHAAAVIAMVPAIATRAPVLDLVT
jgi:hypothetical protein